METQQTLAALRSFSPLVHLEEDELVALSKLCDSKDIKKNRRFICHGDSSTSLYFLLAGRVKVSRVSPEGKEVIFGVIEANNIIGEIAFLRNRKRTADVTAITSCTVLEMTRSAFDQHCRRYCGLPLAIARGIADKLEQADDQLSDLAFLSVTNRLMRLLVTLSSKEDGKWIVHERPSHGDLAAMIGTSREVVSRILKSLETEKRIKAIGRKGYELLSLE